MVTGPLLDRDRPPTQLELTECVGATRPLWERLVGWIEATYAVAGEPLFFGRESGWVLRFRRGGKALVTLLPLADGGFQALVVVGPSAWESVAGAPLSPAIRAAWEAAKPYPDGRWLWPRVTDAAVAEDIERLVAIKSPPPRRPRRADPARTTG